MTLAVVHEKNKHTMILVDPCVVCKKNTHAMTPGVVHEKDTHPMALAISMCGLWKEQTCNHTGCGS